jgi:catechol 2,3-dioxygenase
MDPKLPPETVLGPVHLQVADLARSIAWYRDVIGARVLSHNGATASLGAHGDDRTLLVLQEVRGSEAMPPRGRLGLFHVAWLLPDRAALGRLITHLADLTERVGSADHLVSEALYLQDPDGLGVEIYADRPRDVWSVARGEVEMASLPLDFRDLVKAADGAPYTGLPAGTVIGHVHLHVGDLELSTQFYREVIGFAVTQSSYPGARFLAAGGYHHHLGTNTWAGSSATPATAQHARLLRWTIVLPTANDVLMVRARAEQHAIAVLEDGEHGVAMDDPWGTRVVIQSA